MRFSREDYESMTREELCELMKLTNKATGLMSPKARRAQEVCEERYGYPKSRYDRKSNDDDDCYD